MQTALLFLARGGRRKVEVFERGPYSEASGRHGVTERAYRVLGSGWRAGSLYSEHWTRDEAIRAAVACYREGRPKAALNVFVCSLCRVGSKVDAACSHVD